MCASPTTPLARRDEVWAMVIFVLLLGYHAWGATVGWESKNLPGGEFRQAQTAMSAYYIQLDHDYSLAYPTPVLGKPWSVPMEFPLYQWTVVGVSNLTGLDLTKAGRSVTLACFYLSLPAIFLLLGRLRMPRAARWLMLGLVLTCPLYIHYGRAILIETMALMFSLWFLLVFVEAIEGRNPWLILLANGLGMAAGLVKVTTFMLYLIPAGVWAFVLLWRARPVKDAPAWRPVLQAAGWIAAATAVPFMVTLWWLQFADATKRLNPSGGFLTSSRLTDFNFGTTANRFSAETLGHHWHNLSHNLVWPPVLVLLVLVAVTAGRHWWRGAAVCLGCFASAQILFPTLYAWHEYYAVANAVLLLCGLGFGLAGLLESRLPRAAVFLVLALVFGGQIQLYLRAQFQIQRQPSPGGSGLTEVLKHLTAPNDVLIISGDDWSSMTPYYARRRALMIRNGMEHDQAYVGTAFTALAGEKIGALVLQKSLGDNPPILQQAVLRFGLDARPLLSWHDQNIFLTVAGRVRALATRETTAFDQIEWAAGVAPPPDKIAGEWIDIRRLLPFQLINFQRMSPSPTRFFSSFGPGLDERDGRSLFNAHPDTRICFRPPAGQRRLQTEVWMSPGAYNLAEGEQTDGVELTVSIQPAKGGRRVLYTRLIDPAHLPADRGVIPVSVNFACAAGDELEIFVGPGPRGQNLRDWVFLGKITID